MYLLIEGVRHNAETLRYARAKICKTAFRFYGFSDQFAVELNPGIVDFTITITARLRWDEANELPQTRVCTLTMIAYYFNICRYFSSSGNRYYSYLEVPMKLKRRNWLQTSCLLLDLMLGRLSRLRPLTTIYSARKLRRNTLHIPLRRHSCPSSPITILFFLLWPIDPAGRMDPMASSLHP